MFDFLKKALRASREPKEEAPPPSPLQAMGLRRGGFVSVDPLPFRMLGDRLLFAPPQDSQRIETVGKVDLGAGAMLHRCYLSEDAWIQVSTTAGQIDDLKLFVFDQTKNPSNRASFERWLGDESPIGGRTLEYRGKLFRRVWGDEDDERAPLVAFSETVYSDSDAVPAFRTDHFCMLYEREVEDSERMEYLLVSAEETGDEYCVVYSLGVDVTDADLQVT